jgi:hypothetical protein
MHTDLCTPYDEYWNEGDTVEETDDGAVCATGYGPTYVEHPEHDYQGHECRRCGAENLDLCNDPTCGCNRD